MKPVKALKKMLKLKEEMDALAEPINRVLSSILEDIEVSVIVQAGDGLVVAFSDHDNDSFIVTNSSIEPDDIEALLQMNRDELLSELHLRAL